MSLAPVPSPLATRHSAFFTRLPRELRDAVYAFVFDVPDDVRLVYGFYRTNLNANANVERGEWRLKGCVCARGIGKGTGKGWWMGGSCVRALNGEEKEDNTSRSIVQMVGTRRRAGRCTKCALGVTGWMLSCRQAYTESLRPLYDLNTFTLVNLTPSSLISFLPSLLPPSCASLLTSVCIPFLSLPARRENTLFADTLVESFPNLRRLRVGIFHPMLFHQPRMGFYHVVRDAFVADHLRFLRALKRVVRSFGSQLEHCELVVPTADMFVALGGRKWDGNEVEERMKVKQGMGEEYEGFLRVPVGLADGSKSGIWVVQSRLKR